MIARCVLAGAALLALAGPLFAQDSVATTAVEKTDRSALELKGIAIGMNHEQVKAVLPTAKCVVYGDGSISDCYEKSSTFGGRPAAILVRLLEGQVVYVSATKMTQGDAFDAADALKIKFRAPDTMRNVRITLVRPDRDQSLIYRCPVWLADGGKQRLTVDPAAYTDTKRKFTYAAVTLVDVHLHNDVWQAKKEGRAATDDL